MGRKGEEGKRDREKETKCRERERRLKRNEETETAGQIERGGERRGRDEEREKAQGKKGNTVRKQDR